MKSEVFEKLTVLVNGYGRNKSKNVMVTGVVRCNIVATLNSLIS